MYNIAYSYSTHGKITLWFTVLGQFHAKGLDNDSPLSASLQSSVYQLTPIVIDTRRNNKMEVLPIAEYGELPGMPDNIREPVGGYIVTCLLVDLP